MKWWNTNEMQTAKAMKHIPRDRLIHRKCFLTSLILLASWCSTGSTIRNCDKVKTWLNKIFWQIYQNLMLSGFLSSGNLCLIHNLKLFWPHAASMASNRKCAKNQHEFSWSLKNFFFKTLKDSQIIEFKNLEDWSPQWFSRL